MINVHKPSQQLLAEVFRGQYDNFREFLKQNEVIGLNLSSMNIKNFHVKYLGIALQGTKVRRVDLSWNLIDDQGASDLAANLKDTKVITVYLNWNQIDVIGASNFAKNLKGTQVAIVDLSHNHFGDLGAINFVASLKETNVTLIRLAGNKIGFTGAKILAAKLQDTQVTFVDLSWNQIGDIGAINFVANLKGTQVTHVDLSFNEIGDMGATDLAANLKGTQVTSLDLSWNNIGVKDAKALAIHIPDTLLLNVKLSFDSPELTQALELNRYKLLLFLSPYYLVALKHLPESEKGQYFNLGLESLETEEGRLRYAGGILMNQSLPEGIHEKIIGYLPFMTTHNGLNQTQKYNRVFKENHPDGLKVNSDSKVEEIEEKIRTMRI